MNDTIGINIDEMKNMSKLFLDYRDNINKIFLEYKRIINNSSTYFGGEAGTLYRKRFNDLYNKLDIVVNSFTEYSDTVNNVIQKYTSVENTLSDNLKDIEKKTKESLIK